MYIKEEQTTYNYYISCRNSKEVKRCFYIIQDALGRFFPRYIEKSIVIELPFSYLKITPVLQGKKTDMNADHSQVVPYSDCVEFLSKLENMYDDGLMY